MVTNLVFVHLRRLRHNRIELLLAFVVPIAFFSIFAVIFGRGIGGGTTPRIKSVVVDRSGTPGGERLAATIADHPTLRIMRDDRASKIDPDDARRWVRDGSMTVAIVIRPATSADPASTADPHRTDPSRTDPYRVDPYRVDLYVDASDGVATQVTRSIVAQALGRAAAMRRQTESAPAARQPDLPPTDSPATESTAIDVAEPASHSGPTSDPDPEPIAVIDVLGEGKSNPVVSMYAAGIAVMFLLFGATGGGGALLEERENQTLDRMLCTHLSMDQLLLGKWFYLTLLGTAQVTVMFIWAQLVFGVDLLGHLDGFVMMTVVTAGSSAAFGLCLATLCRSRNQLNGLSVIAVLSMSALGGSMVPRYVMSENLREAGLWTFNAWALDGYDKVFWRELPVASLMPQLTVLMVCGVAFLVTARALAIRWERD